jgi:hypothetical protein
MRQKAKRNLAVGVLTTGLAILLAYAQDNPLDQQLSQSLRSELTSGGQCSLVLQDHLVRLILGPPPDEQKGGVRVADDIAVRQPTSGSKCESLTQRISKLSVPELTELTRALAKQSNPIASSLGANLLFKLGREDEAISVLAGLVAKGQGQQMYLAPSNKYDETLSGRLMVKISRHLLANLGSYQGADRDQVEQYLSIWSSTIPFSRSEAERRINELEAQIKKRTTP